MTHERIEVEAYAGYKGPEMPRVFLWKGRKLEVKKVKRTWYQEDTKGTRYQFFRIQASDKKEYLISYSVREDTWYLENTSNY